jgi:transcriptional pleiotropic regulator of transition state genes
MTNKHIQKINFKGENFMKSTGIVRNLDSLGRIVIPMELRKTFDINEGDAIEVFIDGNTVILKKYQPGCIICDNVDNVKILNGKNICNTCVERIKNT